MVSLVVIASVVQNPISSLAATCRNSGPSAKSLSLGSQVDGRIFTICAQTSASKTVKQKTTTPTKPASSKLVKLNPKVNPVGQVIFKTVKVGNSTRVTFKPVAPKAKKLTSGQISVGQLVNFSVDKKVKLGATVVFGKRLGVRFTPIKILVKFSDGQTSEDFLPSRAFSSTGTYLLSARVTYRVEYRTLVWGETVNKKGAKWVLDPGQITIATNQLKVTVGKTSASKIVLIAD